MGTFICVHPRLSFVVQARISYTMMRVILFVACCLAYAHSAPANGNTAAPSDAFVALIREIEGKDFFKTWSESYRVLTFEMLTSAQTMNMGPFLDKLGHLQLLKYLDLLPKEFQHQFIHIHQRPSGGRRRRIHRFFLPALDSNVYENHQSSFNFFSSHHIVQWRELQNYRHYFDRSMHTVFYKLMYL